MSNPNVPRMTIDTNCVVGLFDTGSQTATSVEQLQELIRHGLSGGADIAVTTRAEFDLRRDEDQDRRQQMLRQLRMLPVIGSVFNLDESVLSVGDVLVGSAESRLWAELQGILFPGLTPASPRYSNKKNDIEHICGHKLAGRDVFVTDDRGILRRHQQLRDGPGIIVMSPLDALQYVDAHHARQQRYRLDVSNGDDSYRNRQLKGIAKFDYSNNDHRFTIGDGLHLFETQWSKASDRSIHALNDAPSIEALALVKNAASFSEIGDARLYDFSSRSRTPTVGQIVIWRNINGLYAATSITGIKDDSRGAEHDELSFEFVILPDGSANFSVDTLQNNNRAHIELARPGTCTDAEVGLIAIGPDIVAGGHVVRFDAAYIVVHLASFLKGSAEDLFALVGGFEARSSLSRYILLSEFGLGGLLGEAPEVARDGSAWIVTFQWLPDALRLPAAKLAGISSRTGQMVSGEEYWKQTFEAVLARPPGTWFADMDGGSHLSELYESLRNSMWFEAFVKCELARLACIPAPPALGKRTSEYPPFGSVRRVLNVRVPDTKLVNERLRIEVEFDLEGHGRWSGDLNPFIYSREALRTERSKAAWMSEGIRRMEKEGRMLPSQLPPDGWDMEDGFPD